MGQDVELWVCELKAAGWVPLRSTLWRAPCGCQFLGPYKAWCEMLKRHAENHALLILIGELPPTVTGNDHG